MKRLILLIVFALFIAGCGVERTETKPDTSGDDFPQPSQTTTTPKVSKKVAPVTAGTIDISGAVRGSMTTFATTSYTNSGRITRVNVVNVGENQAFASLCNGTVDIVDSSRIIAEKEWQVCRDNGLEVVQFQVASDAIVVATKSEVDFGADCLSPKDVQEIYRAGSPIYNWSQLGYDDVELKVSGPDDKNNAFDFFGQYVLGNPQPSISDLRSDYYDFANDRGTREFVVGAEADRDLARNNERYVVNLQRARDNHTAARASLALARQELLMARAERAKGIRDKRSQAQQRLDQRRVTRAEAAFARAQGFANSARKDMLAKQDMARRSQAASRRDMARIGTVGYFRFSYYELYEDQLRPLEIDADPSAKQNCIFPSQQTVTEASYPLARQLLLTTTTRSLKTEGVKDYIKTYLSQSQSIAQTNRFVPLPDSKLAQQQRWLNTNKAPTVKYGSDDDPSSKPKDIVPAS